MVVTDIELFTRFLVKVTCSKRNNVTSEVHAVRLRLVNVGLIRSRGVPAAGKAMLVSIGIDGVGIA